MSLYPSGFFSDSQPDPGPRKFVKAAGSRLLHAQIGVDIAEMADTERHQYAMGKLAERAVRTFAESALEVNWVTLKFEVFRTGMEPEGHEIWRWSVWAS